MRANYLYLGPTPLEEDCAQVGQNGYRQQAEKELTAFVNQLYRQFTEAQEKNVLFKIRWEQHDFGTYGEVVVLYDEDDRDSVEYAFNTEINQPEFWDEEALKELGK